MPRISRFRNLLAGTLRDTVPFAGGNSAAASRQAALLFDLQSWQGCHILEGSLNKGSTGSDRAPGRAFDEMPRSLRTTIVEDRATPPEGKLAGAEGFEPSPSSLTVRCPTS